MKQVLVSGSHLIQDLFSMAALGRQKQQQHGGDLDNSIFDYFQNPNWGQMIFCVILVLPKIDLFLVLPVVHMGEHCCFSSIPDGQCSDFLKWYLLTRPLWGQQSGTLRWRGRSCRQARQTHWQGEAQYSPIKVSSWRGWFWVKLIHWSVSHHNHHHDDLQGWKRRGRKRRSWPRWCSSTGPPRRTWWTACQAKLVSHMGLVILKMYE